MKPCILLLEDEASIADPLMYTLQTEGFTVIWAKLIQEALLHYHHADLLILDVGLPDGNGFELCKQLRKNSDVPVIFLTARSAEIDRVVGLEIGADDYVVKPFSPRELVARVKVILKRLQRQPQLSDPAPQLWQSNAEILQIGDFSLDDNTLQIRLQQQLLSLTALEFKLLRFMLTHPQRVLSREQLLQGAGIAADAGYDRNIDSHIKSLRAKFRQFSTKEYIQTLRGFGYSFLPAGDEINRIPQRQQGMKGV